MKPTTGFVFAVFAAAILAVPPLHATGVQVGVLPSGGCPGEVNEYCPQDCGYCGDHLCQGSETCTTCCGDCGPCPGDPWGSCYQQE